MLWQACGLWALGFCVPTECDHRSFKLGCRLQGFASATQLPGQLQRQSLSMASFIFDSGSSLELKAFDGQGSGHDGNFLSPTYPS